MPVAGSARRQSAAIAVSLFVHAALLATLAGQALVKLTLEPAPILLTLVEPATRTAGPGERSAELRSAAPAETIAAIPPTPVAEPQPQPEPQPVVVPEPKPVVRKPAAMKAVTPPPRSSAEVASRSPVTPASGGDTGADTKSSAPEWAPTARVRYEELLFAWMDRHKQYPLVAQRRGLEGKGSVRVRIGRDGRVLERSVDRSTGETMLDQAALEMVRRANPFPAVPSGYAGDSFEFVAPIEYRLR